MFAQYCRLNVHVAASNRTVIRKSLHLIKARHRYSRFVRKARHQWLRAMLKEHLDARAMYYRVMG